jgi:glyoxylase-like metal-dependent hydrolase (beta-lactamase superfamily II)
MTPREVAPGIICLETDYPQVADAPLWVYLVQGGQTALSDAACSTTYDAVQLEQLGIGPRDIDWLLLTHAHPDHTGAAGSLRAAGSELRVAAPLEDVIYAESFDRQWHDFWQEHAGVVDVEPFHDELRAMSGGDLAVDRILRDGELFDLGTRQLRVVQTRGHTRGHCAYFDEANRVLLSGDAALGRITPSSSGTSMFAPLYVDVDDHVAGLQRLRALPFDVLCPAHHEPVERERGLELIDEALAFVEEADAVVLGALAEAGSSVTLAQVARKLGEHVGMVPPVWAHTAYVARAHLRRAAARGLVEPSWTTTARD